MSQKSTCAPSSTLTIFCNWGFKEQKDQGKEWPGTVAMGLSWANPLTLLWACAEGLGWAGPGHRDRALSIQLWLGLRPRGLRAWIAPSSSRPSRAEPGCHIAAAAHRALPSSSRTVGPGVILCSAALEIRAGRAQRWAPLWGGGGRNQLQEALDGFFHQLYRV